MNLRQATSADRDFIVSLAGRFADFELPPWRTRDDVAGGTAKRLVEALASMNERSTIVVVEDDAGQPLGFAWMMLVEDFFTGREVVKLSEIAVVRNGTGAGAVLMEAVEKWAREHGCPLVFLNVMQHNEHARAFYERHGFAPEYEMMVKPLN